jgi:hypothetical protein
MRKRENVHSGASGKRIHEVQHVTKAKEEPKPGAPDVRVAYFATKPNVTKEIEAWAERTGVRVLSVVPVYWEDVEHA